MKKHIINFSKYLTVGILATILGWLAATFFIDILNYRASIVLLIMNIAVFFIKYVGYRKIRLLKKSFFTFLAISITSTILLTLAEIVMIDYMTLSAFIAIPIAEIILFVLRFLAFYWFRIIYD